MRDWPFDNPRRHAYMWYNKDELWNVLMKEKDAGVWHRGQKGQLFTFPAGAASNRMDEPCHVCPQLSCTLDPGLSLTGLPSFDRKLYFQRGRCYCLTCPHTYIALSPFPGKETICLKGVDIRNWKGNLVPHRLNPVWKPVYELFTSRTDVCWDYMSALLADPRWHLWS